MLDVSEETEKTIIAILMLFAACFVVFDLTYAFTTGFLEGFYGL